MKISYSNWETQKSNIAWPKLDNAINNAKNEVESIIEFYNDDEGIKMVVDLFFEKLNNAISKLAPSKPKGKTADKSKAKFKKGDIVSIKDEYLSKEPTFKRYNKGKVKEVVSINRHDKITYVVIADQDKSENYFTEDQIEKYKEPEQTYDQWERQVTDKVGATLKISNGDAQGIVEAQSFYMQQSWAKGLTANETAKVIIEKSASRKSTRSLISELPLVKKLMPKHQQKFLMQQNSEELDQVLLDLETSLSKIPTKQQSGTIENQTVFAHYFVGGSDWYVLDYNKGRNEFFGYVILNGDTQMAETGYFSANELVEDGRVELDFYFSTGKLIDILVKAYPSYYGKTENNTPDNTKEESKVPIGYVVVSSQNGEGYSDPEIKQVIAYSTAEKFKKEFVSNYKNDAWLVSSDKDLHTDLYYINDEEEEDYDNARVEIIPIYKPYNVLQLQPDINEFTLKEVNSLAEARKIIAETQSKYPEEMENEDINEDYVGVHGDDGYLHYQVIVVERVKNKETKKQSSTTPSKKISKKVDPKTVDNYSNEFMLIRRFYNMLKKAEKKPISFRSLQLLYQAYQKAIVSRDVRKTSPDADLLTKANKKVVGLYELAKPDKADIDVTVKDTAFVNSMKEMVEGSKINYAITLVRSFIGMQGIKPDVKKASNLLKRIETALSKGTIAKDNRLYNEVIEAKKELKEYIAKPSEKIEPETYGLSFPSRSVCTNRIKCTGIKDTGRLKKGYKYVKGGAVVKITAKKKTNKVKKSLGTVVIDVSTNYPANAEVVNEGYASANGTDINNIEVVQPEVVSSITQPSQRTPQKNHKPKVNNNIVSNITNAKNESKNVELFNIKGDLATFLGKLEKKKVHSVVITLDAPPGSGKTRSFFQLADLMADNGYNVVFASLEEHPSSKLFTDKAEMYIKPENEQRIDVIGELPATYEEFINVLGNYDLIIVDSWNKVFEEYAGIDFDKDLRKKLNGKLIATIFQRTTSGQMRGGAKASFDGDVILEIEKADDFRDSYIIARKNRYQDRPLNEIGYNFYHKKLINPESVSSDPSLPAEYSVN